MVSVAMLVYQSAKNNGEKVGHKMWWMDMPMDLVISDETSHHTIQAAFPMSPTIKKKNIWKRHMTYAYFQLSTK